MADIEELYKKYFSDIFLYVKSLSGDAQLAEDITAETFFKALKSLDSFSGRCDIRVWLCQIAKNSYFSYLRKNKRWLPADESAQCADSANLEQTYIDTETSARVHRILHGLPEPYREVFTLRVFGELSFKQIARLFSKTENWACVTFHRAKTKIRDQLEDYQ